MTWQLQRPEYAVFERNPLVAVIAQLRFHPILKIADRLPEFQDRLRSRFPLFSEVASQVIDFKPPNNVQMREERSSQFRKKDDSGASITLHTQALTFEVRNHIKRDDMLADFQLAVEALVELFRPVTATRLGLRYVNLLDRAKIGRDLGRAVDWNDLVSAEFLRLPSVTDLHDTAFATEITSSADSGAMTVRFGHVRDPDGQFRFRFDTDRYVEGEVDLNQSTDQLKDFSGDIYSIFVAAMGTALREWMEK